MHSFRQVAHTFCFNKTAAQSAICSLFRLRMADAGAQKRKAEDEVNAIGAAELGDTAAPAAKKAKVDGTEGDELPATTVAAARDGGIASTTDDLSTVSAPAAQSSAAAAATDDTAAPPVAAAGITAAEAQPTAQAADTDAAMADDHSDPPQTIGYKTFNSGDDAFQYFHDLMHNLRQNQDLNEYEAYGVLDLLKKGHPEAAAKMGAGVNSIQVRAHLEQESVCFHLMRADTSVENFSMRKCVIRMFPNWGVTNQKKFAGNDNGSRGGRGGRGRGGGSRGRAGRGGRRGRGRGRGRG